MRSSGSRLHGYNRCGIRWTAIDCGLDASGPRCRPFGKSLRFRRQGDGFTTVAGDGTSCAASGACAAAVFGDGGPVVSAAVTAPVAIAVTMGDLYIADPVGLVREVKSGVIQTIAGMGGDFYYGDGGPATAAGFYLSLRAWPSIALVRFTSPIRPTTSCEPLLRTAKSTPSRGTTRQPWRRLRRLSCPPLQQTHLPSARLCSRMLWRLAQLGTSTSHPSASASWLSLEAPALFLIWRPILEPGPPTLTDRTL